MSFLLNPFQFAVGNADPHWDNVITLLQGEGVDGGTTFTDLSSTPSTFTLAGTPVTSTTNPKYGNASISLDGSSWLHAALEPAKRFNIRTDDYTVECWARATVANSDAALVCFKSRDVGTDTYRDFYPMQFFVNVVLRLFTGDSNENNLNPATTFPTTWAHYALSKSGSTTRSFQDGVLLQSTQVLLINSIVETVIIGNRGLTPYVSLLGNLDAVRVTKGVGRYTASFNPETDTYLN